MKRIACLLSGLVLLLLNACQNTPFQVVNPNPVPEEGSALISVRIPSFSRGLVQRVTVQVTEADTGRIRPIQRDLNFPLPGGSLASGQIAEIPSGKRRFRVRALDTNAVVRFEGVVDSVITTGRLKIIEVGMSRVGGRVDFTTTIDVDADSALLSTIHTRALLDILEIVADPVHPSLSMLPLASVGLGDGLRSSDGVLSRHVSVDQIPSGSRRFVAYLRDVTSKGALAYADTIEALDVLAHQTVSGEFELKRVTNTNTLKAIFEAATLPPDSSVVVITPQF